MMKKTMKKYVMMITLIIGIVMAFPVAGTAGNVGTAADDAGTAGNAGTADISVAVAPVKTEGMTESRGTVWVRNVPTMLTYKATVINTGDTVIKGLTAGSSAKLSAGTVLNSSLSGEISAVLRPGERAELTMAVPLAESSRGSRINAEVTVSDGNITKTAADDSVEVDSIASADDAADGGETGAAAVETATPGSDKGSAGHAKSEQTKSQKTAESKNAAGTAGAGTAAGTPGTAGTAADTGETGTGDREIGIMIMIAVIALGVMAASMKKQDNKQ
ncbi:MAG: hypothetical protein VB031_09340 [Eubacteriaceae bacterium]|nr:hypothetical protein [Eubacteriaceae bacterium]